VKGQGHWERKCKKIVFCAYLRQKWIDLRQTKTKMINGPFYTIPAKMLRFVITAGRQMVKYGEGYRQLSIQCTFVHWAHWGLWCTFTVV